MVSIGSKSVDEYHLHLLRAAVEGDNVAFSQLIRETQSSVWKLCSVLGSGSNIEDLVQETYLSAIRSLPGFRSDASVTVWLLAIARNVCADDVRRRARDRRLIDKVAKQLLVDGDVAHIPVPMNDLLMSINPERREAFLLTQYIGLSYEEVACILQCPIGTVRSRVARARTELAEQIRLAEAQ